MIFTTQLQAAPTEVTHIALSSLYGAANRIDMLLTSREHYIAYSILHLESVVVIST